MEQFYELLKEYNSNFISKVPYVPEWFYQYTQNEPPLYWKTIYEILKHEDRNQAIVEIGAGYGDVTSLLYFMGFRNITSFEYDSNLIEPISDKIQALFGVQPKIINNKYPEEIINKPDIIIQVNCVYSIELSSKTDYLNQIRNFYKFNGIPNLFIFEYIDESYTEENDVFPKFIRLNDYEISQLFPGCHIDSYLTYKYPKNKTTKKICSIKTLQHV